MGIKKAVGLVLLVVGIVIVVLAVVADSIGIGQAPGFGRNQLVGAIVGAFVMVVGLVVRFVLRNKE